MRKSGGLPSADLGSWAARRPDAEAVVIVDPDDARPAERITYGALDAAANRLARALRRAGLRRDDRVAFVLGNEPAVFTVFWAAMRTGLHVRPGQPAPAGPGDPLHPRGRHGRRRDRLAGRRRRLARRRRRPPRPPAHPDGGRDPGGGRWRDEAADPIDDAEEGQLLLYSSGTTGRPKGILRPLPGFGPGQGPTTGSEIAAGFGLVDGDRYLSTGPLYHSAPFAFSTAQQRIGATAVVMTRFDAAAALRVLVEEEITTSQWVPTMFSRLLALPDDVREAFRAPRHRLAMHAAAPCPVGREAADDRLVGADPRRVLQRQRGWPHDDHQRRVARPARVRRAPLAGRTGLGPRPTGRALPARRPSAGSSSTPRRRRTASATSATRRRRRPPTTPPGPASRSATSAGSTTTATSSSPTGTAT